jgi:hypothetical protein
MYKLKFDFMNKNNLIIRLIELYYFPSEKIWDHMFLFT